MEYSMELETDLFGLWTDLITDTEWYQSNKQVRVANMVWNKETEVLGVSREHAVRLLGQSKKKSSYAWWSKAQTFNLGEVSE